MGVIEEFQSFPTELKAEVVGGALTDASKTDIIYRHAVRTLTYTFISNIAFFAITFIYTAPNKHIKVEIAFTKYSIGLYLTVVADTDLSLQAIYIGTLFGDDIYYCSKSHTAIERRCRTA